MSNFIRIPYSVYEIFNSFKLLSQISVTDSTYFLQAIRSVWWVTSSRSRDTVPVMDALMSAETPDFSNPLDWPPNSPKIDTLSARSVYADVISFATWFYGTVFGVIR